MVERNRSGPQPDVGLSPCLPESQGHVPRRRDRHFLEIGRGKVEVGPPESHVAARVIPRAVQGLVVIGLGQRVIGPEVSGAEGNRGPVERDVRIHVTSVVRLFEGILALEVDHPRASAEAPGPGKLVARFDSGILEVDRVLAQDLAITAAADGCVAARAARDGDLRRVLRRGADGERRGYRDDTEIRDFSTHLGPRGAMGDADLRGVHSAPAGIQSPRRLDDPRGAWSTRSSELPAGTIDARAYLPHRAGRSTRAG